VFAPRKHIAQTHSAAAVGVIAELQNQYTRQLELLLYIVLQLKEAAIYFAVSFLFSKAKGKKVKGL
jgi:hypothetical protein